MVTVHSPSKYALRANIRTRREARAKALSMGLRVTAEGECDSDGKPGWHGWIWSHGEVQSKDAWADEYDATIAGLQYLMGAIASVLPLDVELPQAEGKAA